MQIVIDIDEDEYNILKNYTGHLTYSEYLIKNGTPLPKGHSRLIDAKNLIEELECTFDGTLAKTWNEMALLITDIIEEVPTVIVADTETWNSCHGQVTAPKGTMKKIYEDADNNEHDI